MNTPIMHGTTYEEAVRCGSRTAGGTCDLCRAAREAMGRPVGHASRRPSAAARVHRAPPTPGPPEPTASQLGDERLQAAGRRLYNEIVRDMATQPAVSPLRVACARCGWEHVGAPQEAVQAGVAHREAHYGPPV